MDMKLISFFPEQERTFFIYYSRKGLHLLGLYLPGKFRSTSQNSNFGHITILANGSKICGRSTTLTIYQC